MLHIVVQLLQPQMGRIWIIGAVMFWRENSLSAHRYEEPSGHRLRGQNGMKPMLDRGTSRLALAPSCIMKLCKI